MTLSHRDVLQAAAAAALAGLGQPGGVLAAPGDRWTRSVCRACTTGEGDTPARAGRGEARALVAGVVIETVAGAAPRVAARLLSEPGLELRGGDGDRRLAAVFTGPDGAALVALGERLLGRDEELLGLYPAFVWTEGT